MTATHTPTPWVGFNDQGKLVAIMPAMHEGDICTFSQSPSTADGDFILTAVNSHASLKARNAELESALRCISVPVDVAAMKARIEKLECELREVCGCFDAAYAEGLSERLAEAKPETGTLADLILRRLIYAHDAAISALQPKSAE